MRIVFFPSAGAIGRRGPEEGRNAYLGSDFNGTFVANVSLSPVTSTGTYGYLRYRAHRARHFGRLKLGSALGVLGYTLAKEYGVEVVLAGSGRPHSSHDPDPSIRIQRIHTFLCSALRHSDISGIDVTD
jgi:hypothetical protein